MADELRTQFIPNGTKINEVCLRTLCVKPNLS
jgi:threonine aldolase